MTDQRDDTGLRSIVRPHCQETLPVDVELRMTLADLRTAEGAVRDEPYPRLPALAGSLALAAHRMELLHERGERLEKALSYAVTTERTNTDDWMRGMADAINRVLVADGDHQRCVYNGDRLLLRSIRQVASPHNDQG